MCAIFTGLGYVLQDILQHAVHPSPTYTVHLALTLRSGSTTAVDAICVDQNATTLQGLFCSGGSTH